MDSQGNQGSHNPLNTRRDPVKQVQEIARQLTSSVSFGTPIDIDSTGAVAGQRVGQIAGSWVTVTLTAAATNQVCVHNLNIPPTTVTGGAATAKLPNVRWLLFGAEYGDRTGANAAPASPAAFTLSVVKMVNATVSANSLQLRFLVTGVTPSATEPVTVTLFFVPAVE